MLQARQYLCVTLLLSASLVAWARPQAAPQTIPAKDVSAAAEEAMPAAAARARDPATMQTGRALSRALLDGETQALWARMTPEMQQAMGNPAALAQFREQLAQQLGEEQALVEEVTQPQGDYRVYQRTARWTKAPGPIVMQWALDDQDRIAGFFVRPQPQLAASDHLHYQTRNTLRLPFNGQWYVFWGGRTLQHNYHAANANQRFAYDFLQRVDGQSHRGDGTELDDYYCWGEPILAPADARVVSLVEDLPDQAIGTRNTESPAGNHVVLDLGNDEYALLAHLQQASVRVQAGQQVQAGQVLGLCGNSGNTSEPHLHFHLQDSPRALQGAGLPAQFVGYTADGALVARGEPLKGQSIAPLPAQPDDP